MATPSLSINPAFLILQARSVVASPYSRVAYILAALTLFAPLIEGGTTHFPVFVMRTVLFLSCLAWILSSWKDGSMSLQWNTVSPWILSFLTLAAVSVMWTPYKHAAVQWVVTLAMYAIFFQLAYQGLKSFRDVRILVIIILVTGALQAALGILQYGIFDEYRAHGTFFNPNFFASYQAGIVVLAGALLCFSGDLDISTGKRAALWALLIVSVVAFVLARSRGALLALVPVLFFIALMRFRRRAIPFLLCGLLAVIIIPNPIRARSLEVASQDHFAYTRLDIWKNAMARIADQPWGSGLGMYKYVSFKSRFPIEGELARYGRRAESAHNEYLQIASELGLGGLFIVLTGAVLWGKEVKHVCVDQARSARRAIMIGLTGIVSAILIHALVDSVFHEPALVLLLILAAAMVLAMGRMRCSEDPPQPQLVIGYTRCRALIGGLILSILLVLTVQPATAWYAFEQGNSALSSGDLRRSVRWYAIAIKIEPWNASYHNALASSEIALFQQSKDRAWIVDAVEEMKMCSTLNALDGRYPYRLGTLYQLLAETAETSQEKSARRLAEAADSFRQAVIRDPYFPPSRVALGKIQRLDGELRQARTSFSEALELEPNYLPARALRIQVDMELGNSTLARDEYREMLTIAERWRGKATTALEMQFLDVDWDQLKRLVQS